MRYYKQEKNYTCGCACFRMVLSHFNFEIPDEIIIEQELNTNDQIGTLPESFKTVCDKYHLSCIIKENSTIEEIDTLTRNGWCVLLAISVDVPHWVVYISNNGNHLKVQDPFFGSNRSLSIKKFTSFKTSNPTPRWKIIDKEFKLVDYDFTTVESTKLFVALRPKDFIEYDGKTSSDAIVGTLLHQIIDLYTDSEVTSGEYIYSLKFDKRYDIESIEKAITMILKWDDSNEIGSYKLNSIENYYNIIYK